MLKAPLNVRQMLNRERLFLASMLHNAITLVHPNYNSLILLNINTRMIILNVDGERFRYNLHSKSEIKDAVKYNRDYLVGDWCKLINTDLTKQEGK